MGRKKEQEHKTLARWIIDKTNTDHYRAGMLSGWKHPYIDADVMEIVIRSARIWHSNHRSGCRKTRQICAASVFWKNGGKME